jgi:hypothetical protein
MRRLLTALCLLGAASALAEERRVVVAPAGECAGEERELAANLLPKPGDGADRKVGTQLATPFGSAPASAGATPPAASAATHLSPAQVAGAPSAATTTPPAPPVFGGPGACDDPGSGCSTGKVVEDPDPGTGCGFPGSPCP